MKPIVRDYSHLSIIRCGVCGGVVNWEQYPEPQRKRCECRGGELK